MTKFVFFDCDGVIGLGNSWVKLHSVAGVPEGLDYEWFSAYRDGKITVQEWVDKIEVFYKSHSFTKNTLKKVTSLIEINHEAREIVDYLKNKKVDMAVISGSYDEYVKHIADDLGIDTWKANYSFSFNEDGSLKKINFVDDEPQSKVHSVLEICKSLEIKSEETIFVGDSFNDVEAFKLTKHGVLYKNTEADLEKYAWKKIAHLSELKELVNL